MAAKAEIETLRDIVARYFESDREETAEPRLLAIKPSLPYGHLFRRRRRQRDDGIRAVHRWVKSHGNSLTASMPFHVDRNLGAHRIGFETGRKILSRQRLIIDIDQQVIAA